MEEVPVGSVDEVSSTEVMEPSLADYTKEPYICESLPVKFLRNKAVLPLALDGGVLSVVIEDTEDVDTLDAIRLVSGLELKVCKGKREEILGAIDRFYGTGAATVDNIVGDISHTEGGESAEDVDHLVDMASEAPVIRLVNLIITRAVEDRASDIHLEPFEETFRVRYRVDDILYEAELLPMRLHAAVTSRLKIMANLNIAERRLPQDGRIKITVSGRDIDIRVATIPTSYGESIVLRILDRQALVLDLDNLGLTNKCKEVYESMISRPYGMILVTGPTGSGKTTTLYTTLEKLNTPKKKIVTVEDPIEYHLHGVNQIQVKPQIGLDFANGLRHILRHDPNIIMVGEIRDRETAETAVQSALTGHLVFSTLHTNDAPGAIIRLLEMGVEDYLLASSLIGVIAQRLVRVICSSCKEPYNPGDKEQLLLQSFAGGNKQERVDTLYKGGGCEQCGSTGYKGRIAIYEVLQISKEISKLILQRSDSGTIKSKAVELGMKRLREDGFDKIIRGITTVDEVLRVTQEDWVD
jgi:general secretion pathway protein E